MEITVTKKDGSSKLVHSKKGGDGAISESNIKRVIEKIQEFVEK